MSNFHLRIVTPDSMLFDGEAKRLIVRTAEGDVCIMARHINFLAPLGIGEAKVEFEDGSVRKAAAAGGMLTVVEGDVNVIATTFEWADEIDVDRAEKARDEAEAFLRDHKEQDQAFTIAEAKLKRAITRIQATR